ncbi:OLC1v1027601C1 [Oldenlandia corymbosa var. corymbosa]|uniref:OLC1v1027601C1 n=1 Tax=Oldenlandia corymbosa var. corymbosa TaxID=529605 RepID=A0AAV1C9V0_OLDCO|nr:OLC1v1027601C1 [Oldenlandia corymbosa var. corymbosa]
MGIRKLTTSGMVKGKKRVEPGAVVHKYVSSNSKASVVPKGYLAVYVGDDDGEEDQSIKCKHRFVVPVSYLKHPLFQDLLRLAEEEFGFDYPMGGLTIPCSKNAFAQVISQLNQGFNSYINRYTV